MCDVRTRTGARTRRRIRWPRSAPASCRRRARATGTTRDARISAPANEGGLPQKVLARRFSNRSCEHLRRLWSRLQAVGKNGDTGAVRGGIRGRNFSARPVLGIFVRPLVPGRRCCGDSLQYRGSLVDTRRWRRGHAGRAEQLEQVAFQADEFELRDDVR